MHRIVGALFGALILGGGGVAEASVLERVAGTNELVLRAGPGEINKVHVDTHRGSAGYLVDDFDSIVVSDAAGITAFDPADGYCTRFSATAIGCGFLPGKTTVRLGDMADAMTGGDQIPGS